MLVNLVLSAPRTAETFVPGLLQGGEFVTARAREAVSGESGYISFVVPPVEPHPEKLRRSKFNTPEDIAAFAQKFDESLKRVFCEISGAQYVKFGSPRDNDPAHGVKAGRLTLTG